MTQPPPWLQQLVDRLTSALNALEALPPIGCHFARHDGVWEVTLFASQTEVIGGPLDGRRTHARFQVDLQHVMAAFDRLDACFWQAQELGFEDDLGPHVSIEGLVGDEHVWLRITAFAPTRFEPGRLAYVLGQTWKEVW